MKKLFFLSTITIFLIAGMMVAKPAAAWTAINGTVYAATGVPWTLGGTVEVFDNAFVSCGTSAISGSGTYSVPIPGVSACTPTNGQPLYVVLQTNSGPGGTPSTQFVQLTQFPIGAPFIQNFNTGTAPTAVTLSGITAPAATTSLPYLFAGLVTLLGAASYVALRRRPVVA